MNSELYYGTLGLGILVAVVGLFMFVHTYSCHYSYASDGARWRTRGFSAVMIFAWMWLPWFFYVLVYMIPWSCAAKLLPPVDSSETSFDPKGAPAKLEIEKAR